MQESCRAWVCMNARFMDKITDDHVVEAEQDVLDASWRRSAFMTDRRRPASTNDRRLNCAKLSTNSR
ncbi:hypothetical protein AM571_CH01862 [Rhizobium etli 8C-3]|uniref:Uncharacterized protein n=1 Tax=Rhizobium etli 8C-3 TaxID=538025 RepID=A0A1L5P3G1_RHIET|nr:hypothetical protein AM571_CH01862 [Rhizobium etli 8C-3]